MVWNALALTHAQNRHASTSLLHQTTSTHCSSKFLSCRCCDSASSHRPASQCYRVATSKPAAPLCGYSATCAQLRHDQCAVAQNNETASSVNSGGMHSRLASPPRSYRHRCVQAKIVTSHHTDHILTPRHSVTLHLAAFPSDCGSNYWVTTCDLFPSWKK